MPFPARWSASGSSVLSIVSPLSPVCSFFKGRNILSQGLSPSERCWVWWNTVLIPTLVGSRRAGAGGGWGEWGGEWRRRGRRVGLRRELKFVSQAEIIQIWAHSSHCGDASHFPSLKCCQVTWTAVEFLWLHDMCLRNTLVLKTRICGFPHCGIFIPNKHTEQPSVFLRTWFFLQLFL